MILNAMWKVDMWLLIHLRRQSVEQTQKGTLPPGYFCVCVCVLMSSSGYDVPKKVSETHLI